MKVSLNWLTDYVDISMSAGELAELIVSVGFGVEEIVQTETDVVLDLEITSNRPDLLGHVGVARELAAAAGAKFRPPVIGQLPVHGNVADLTGVEVPDPQLCPRYTARVIRGAKVGPSPKWMVERLQAVGMRSINNVVDVTNYVLMEYSQPLHSFDLDKLAGRRIVVRRARNGEHIVSIDGTKCELNDTMLVIADAEKPVAIAGVMGGLNTEVGEQTVNVLIESAQFDPLSIRHTSRRLQLMSESNYRFERGVDPVAVDEASLRACQLILQTAGGLLAGGVADVWAKPFEPPVVRLRPERCDAILGVTVPPGRQVEILQRLGLSPLVEGGRIACTIPPHRPDLRREIDLIEEVARLDGYAKIPVGGQVTHAVRGEALPQRTRRQIGRVLAAAGFDEAVTFTFIDRAEAELFGWAETVRVNPRVRKTNNVLRPTLLPSLLRACKANQDAGNADVSLFELAAVFPPGRGTLPDEYVQIGMVTTGDLRDLRGAVEAIVAQVAADAALDVREAPARGFADGAAAEILLDGEPAGTIGRLDRGVLDFHGLESPIAAATMRLEALLKRAGKTPTYCPIPRLPAVKRDLSFIVEEAVTWRQVQATIDAVRQSMRAGVDHVTTYRGKPIPDGKKSVTVTLTYRSAEGTLRSEQVDEQVADVVSAMKQTWSAELRA